MCWKSIFSSLFIFSGANNLDHFWMGGIGGRNFMVVRSENLPMKYPWGNLGRQVENVCPLGAEKGQSLPSSALRLLHFILWYLWELMQNIFLSYKFSTLIKNMFHNWAEFMWQYVSFLVYSIFLICDIWTQ